MASFIPCNLGVLIEGNCALSAILGEVMVMGEAQGGEAFLRRNLAFCDGHAKWMRLDYVHKDNCWLWWLRKP